MSRRRSTREEILERAKIARRKRYENMKSDPVLYALQKEKEHQRYLKRKEEKKILSIGDMTPKAKRQQRKKWRENFNKFYKKKKIRNRGGELMNANTPNCSVNEDLPGVDCAEVNSEERYNRSQNQREMDDPRSSTSQAAQEISTEKELKKKGRQASVRKQLCKACSKPHLSHQATSIQVDHLKRKVISSRKASLQTSIDNNLEREATALNEQEPARKQIRLVATKLTSCHDDKTDSEESDTAVRLENTSTVVTTPGLCEDEFHFFGMNVAAQLRRLPLHIALQLQTEFQNTLYLARVGQTSPTGVYIEDTTMQTNEDVSDSDSIEHDVDDKEFSLNSQNAIEGSIGSHVSDETVQKSSGCVLDPM